MRKIVLTEERVKVLATFSEEGSVLQGTKRGSCEGFEIELALESTAPEGAIAELLRLAHRMCFTEAALAAPVKITTRHCLNGVELPGFP